MKKGIIQTLAEYYTLKAYESDIKQWQTAHKPRQPPNTENDRPTQKQNKQGEK